MVIRSFLPSRILFGLLVVSILLVFQNARAATQVHVGAGPGGLSFVPDPVNIQPGDTVDWIWDASGHSVTSGTAPTPDGMFDTGLQGVGFMFSFQFNSAGTFPYFCTRHGAMMVGTVNVAAPSPSPSPTPATCLRYNITLDGSQEVPPNNSTGMGTGIIEVNTVTNQLSYNITFSGLSSPEIAAHIHGFAPRGQEAGVIHTLPAGNPKIGVFNFSEAQQADILAGLSYANIHTSNFGGGEIRGQIDGSTVPCASPSPTPSTTPNPTPTATATTAPLVSISGTVSYCSNPSLNPVPGVTMTLTGTAGGVTATDGSGNYLFSSLPSGGSYTVTPSKATLPPGAVGINTIDVIAIQRHFLSLGVPLSGCRLTAADVNGLNGVNTVDVIATQRFFLNFSSGIANVGGYRFNPTTRSYNAIVTNQFGQNYDGLVFGDVASGFVH